MTDDKLPIKFDGLNLPAVRDFMTLVQQIDKENPDPAHLQELRHMLTQHPDLWRVAGDLSYEAALHLIKDVKANPVVYESLKHGWQALKEELAQQGGSALERLLIDQVVLCWLQLNLLECHYADITGKTLVLDLTEHWEKRLSAAQNRYLRACQALAQTRNLTRFVPVQLNIAAKGGQQLNLATPLASGSDFQTPFEAAGDDLTVPDELGEIIAS
jgi:hypothetical protein